MNSSLSVSSYSSEKTCNMCTRMLPLGSYHNDSQKADGHRGTRKECRSEHRRELRKRAAHEATDDSDTEVAEPPKRVCRPYNMYVMAFSTDVGGALHGLKIDKSHNIEERARDLTASLPIDMIVLATIPGAGHIESAVHSHLASRRNTNSNAREWFRVSLTEAMIAIAVMLPAESISSP